MVRRAEGTFRDQPARVHAGDAVDPRHLDRLGARHRRQDRRQPAREHRLAGPGRPLEQQVVAACGRDLEREQRRGVAADVSQIGAPRRAPVKPGSRPEAPAPARRRAPRRPRARCRHRPPRALRRAPPRGLAPAARAASRARRMGSLRDGQRPGRVAQLAAQRQLPEHGVRVERLRRDLAARREHGQRQRRVEPGTHLAQERRREVGGDPALRELEPRVQDRRADPVARLAHGRVAEADDRERRQAGADVDLDPHLAGIDPVDRERGDASEHGATLRGDRVTGGSRVVPTLRTPAASPCCKLTHRAQPRVTRRP